MTRWQHVWTAAFLLTLAALFTVFTPVQAQDTTTDDLPEQIEPVLAALGQGARAQLSVQDLDAVQVIPRDFGDTSLDCPRPGESYLQVITPGFQFLVTYNGTTYDYRVSQDGKIVVLCDVRPAPPVEPTAPPPQPTAEYCGGTYTVARGDTLLSIAARCDTSVAALMAVNPNIPRPSLVYAGMTLTIPPGSGPRAVAISPVSGPPGTLVNIYASGFPPGAQVQLGWGPSASEYQVVATREIGNDGELYGALPVPAYQAAQQLVVVIVLNGQATVSNTFTVSAGQVTPPPAPTTPPEGALFDQTQIYLVALGDEGRSGQAIGCGDSIVPVTVTFEPTVAPLTAALETMFAIDSRIYGESGLYNALYQSDLEVEGIDIINKVATINLSGTLQVGGVCDLPRVEAQLEQTALQYVTIDSVNINLNGQPLATVLSQR